MGREIEYTPRERFWLWTLAVFGFAIINGAFLHGLLFQPGTLADAMTNPSRGIAKTVAATRIAVPPSTAAFVAPEVSHGTAATPRSPP